MWKLIFNSTTNRGVSANREPLIGEFAVDRDPVQCAWFMSEPSRYQYVNGVFSEVSASIRAAEKKERDIAEMRQRIKAERDSRTSGGVRMDTFWYPSDGESRILYLDWKDQARDQLEAGALKTDPLLVDDVQAVIERLDGISQNLTIDNIFTLVDKCRRLMRKLDAARKAHIEAMKVATDPSAYDYKTTLWPNRYN